MKKLFSFTLLAAALFAVLPASAQTALTATTLTAAITPGTRTIPVASAAGISVGTELFFGPDAAKVISINGLNVYVAPRGAAGTMSFGHVSGGMVLFGPPNAFVGYDPGGSCTPGSGMFLYSPVVNLTTGRQWLCSIIGVRTPGFGPQEYAVLPTTAVASAAGLITPSGPLFHITGTAAITGFNIPVGFDPKGGGQICAIPDAIFTTTAANNIALASTAVVNKVLCWTYDANTAKFVPSY
jgi:hypothetical protein